MASTCCSTLPRRKDGPSGICNPSIPEVVGLAVNVAVVGVVDVCGLFRMMIGESSDGLNIT